MQALPAQNPKTLAIGFSGGGDSLALLTLACAHFGPERIYALIVDHALRGDSAQEAETAANTARALGATARVLRWETPHGGQRHARTARYALLAKACREIGTDTVYLAHTEDDQDETFMMRLAGGSRSRGLAAMSTYAPFPLWPKGRGLWLARPLLSMRRHDLRQYLNTHNLRWIDDPSNQNRRYMRVRARQKLTALYTAGLEKGRMARSAAHLGQLEDRRRENTRALLKYGLHLDPAGFARLSRLALGPITLGAVLAAVSGKAGMPLSPALVDKTATRLAQKAFKPFCTAGCCLSLMGDDILISRDPGAILGRAPDHQCLRTPMTSGQGLIFDQRFEITMPCDGHIEALGRRAKNLSKAQRRHLLRLPAAVRPLIPVLVDTDGGLSSPLLGDAGHAIFLGQEIITRKLASFSH